MAKHQFAPEQANKRFWGARGFLQGLAGLSRPAAAADSPKETPSWPVMQAVARSGINAHSIAPNGATPEPSKTVVPRKRYRGFESPPLRLRKPGTAYRNPVGEAGFSRLSGECGATGGQTRQRTRQTTGLPGSRVVGRLQENRGIRRNSRLVWVFSSDWRKLRLRAPVVGIPPGRREMLDTQEGSVPWQP